MRPGKTKNAAMVDAFAHPLRLQILSALDDGPSSPSELAGRLGEPLHAVGYHMRRLVELGYVELVEERVLRGTIEHIYRAVDRAEYSDEAAGQLSLEQRQENNRVVLQMIWRDVLGALDGDGFARRPDVNVQRAPLVFDDKGWREVAALLLGVLNEACAISAASLARLEESGDDAIKARLVTLLFEAPDSA